MPKESRIPPALRTLYALTAAVGLIGIVALGLRHGGISGGGGRPAATPEKPRVEPLRGVTVILDPGHGGVDSGAIRGGCREDVVNYRLSATIAAALRREGANVAYTVRSAALDIPLEAGKAEPPLVIPKDARLIYNGAPARGSRACLYQRAAVARSHWEVLSPEQRAARRGLYFLSIHHDDSRGARGGRVAYDRRAGVAPPLASALARRLAEAGLDGGAASRRRSLRFDPRSLGVLNPAYNIVPQRVLLEAATISNPTDRNLARSRQWRWRMAGIVVATIGECEGRRTAVQGEGSPP